jgi:hypothetical protein
MCLIASRRHTTVILLQRPKEVQNKDSRKIIKRNKPPHHEKVQSREKLDKKGNVPNCVASTHYGHFATKTEESTE